MDIGERIRYRREQLELTQEELARKIGYKSKTSINKIELGIQNLKQSKIKAIADALQTTPGYIMGWEGIDEREKYMKALRLEAYMEKFAKLNEANKEAIETMTEVMLRNQEK